MSGDSNGRSHDSARLPAQDNDRSVISSPHESESDGNRGVKLTVSSTDTHAAPDAVSPLSHSPASDRSSSANQFRFSAEVEPFKPKGQRASVSKVSGPVIARSPPIQIGSSTAKANTPPKKADTTDQPTASWPPEVVDGPPFASDCNPSTAPSRFVVFRGIPHDWIVSGSVQNMLDVCGLGQQVLSSVAVGANEPVPYLYLYLDDLRDGHYCLHMFKSILKRDLGQLITEYEYFAQEPSHPKAMSLSRYDGQVSFVVTFCGPVQDSDMNLMYHRIHDWASDFGEIRTFQLVRVIDTVKAAFRAEYFKLSSAEAILNFAGPDRRIDPSYGVTIQEYSPPGYARYSHPAIEAHAKSRHPTSTPDAGYQMSPTKRTAWVGSYALTPGEVLRLGGSTNPASERSVSSPTSPTSPASPVTPGSQTVRGSRSGYPSDHLPRYTSSQYHQTVAYHRMNGSGSSGRGFPSFHGHDKAVVNSESADSRGLRRKREQNGGQAQVVDVNRIENGLDVRTTLMVRNVPNKVTWADFKRLLDETNLGQYDFSYVRTDFSNACNVGYAFVNFIRPEHIIAYHKARVGKPWPECNSDKICEVSYATIQGQDCLIQKFRNSSVMREYPGYRPKLWYSDESDDIPEGLSVGDERDFPSPDNWSKLSRSLDNAQAVGLFPPRGSQQGRDDRRHRSQFDRGTPRAMREEGMRTLMPPARQAVAAPPAHSLQGFQPVPMYQQPMTSHHITLPYRMAPMHPAMAAPAQWNAAYQGGVPPYAMTHGANRTLR